MNEVLHKVLSEPIRPHFSIVNVGCGFELQKIMQLVRDPTFRLILVFMAQALFVLCH